MLKEFIESISRLATEAVEPKTVAVPGDGRSQILRLGDKIELASVAPPVRVHSVYTLEDLVNALDKYTGDTSSIWHGHHEVTAVLDDEDRRDLVGMALQESEQLATLRKLPKTFDQRGLVTFLRRDMANAVSDSMVAIFRGISFRRADAGNGVVTQGGESLGRSVEAAVEGTGQIPEVLSFNVPIYTNVGLRRRYPIAVDVDVNPREATFTLTVLPDEISIAVQAMQDYIHTSLTQLVEETIGKTDDVRIFFGCP
jgi:hypothetical protein